MADSGYNITGSVDGILGVGLLARHLSDGVLRSPLGLLAQNTAFGWIVSGEMATQNPNESKEQDKLVFVTMAELNAQIKKLWELDEIPKEAILSAEEQACEESYKSNIVRKQDRYSVSLLLKPDQQLGTSKPMALRRFYGLENRFKKNPELKQAYVQFMREYEQLGHMRLADPLDPTRQHYYIPHHAVAIEKKFRVVFDASAKTSSGKALNDIKYVGPRLQSDLTDIVMSFRIN